MVLNRCLTMATLSSGFLKITCYINKECDKVYLGIVASREVLLIKC